MPDRHSGAMLRIERGISRIPRCAIAHPRSAANAPSRNDVALTCVHVLAAQFARAVQIFSAHKNRGRRESRVRAAPAVSRAKCANKNAHEHTGSAEAIRPSLRNGFTTYTALSPVTGLSCHRRLAEDSARLDAGVGASGPHGFAVRVSTFRQARIRVHRIQPRVRDDRDTPLCGVDGGSSKVDLPDGTSGIFFAQGLDSRMPSQRLICPSGAPGNAGVATAKPIATHRIKSIF
jgi:hypothetical protein